MIISISTAFILMMISKKLSRKWVWITLACGGLGMLFYILLILSTHVDTTKPPIKKERARTEAFNTAIIELSTGDYDAIIQTPDSIYVDKIQLKRTEEGMELEWNDRTIPLIIMVNTVNSFFLDTDDNFLFYDIWGRIEVGEVFVTGGISSMERDNIGGTWNETTIRFQKFKNK
jgi:hypothetical protein